MRTHILVLLLAFLPTLGGCRTNAEVPEDYCDRDDLRGAGHEDMGDMAAPLKCAAAKGLSGDILSDLCLDMDKIDTQGLMSRGFNLAASMVNCGGWEVASNKLQPKSINAGGGMVNCGLLLPKIPVDAKYSRVTLALIHQANLPDTNQQARMELPKFPVPMPIWIWGGAPITAVSQRTIIEIDKSSIPSGPDAQASLVLAAQTGSPMPSWTITSIAVLGQTQ